jgi:hypothetical protein
LRASALRVGYELSNRHAPSAASARRQSRSRIPTTTRSSPRSKPPTVFASVADSDPAVVDAYTDAVNAYNDAVDAYTDAVNAYNDAVDALHDFLKIHLSQVPQYVVAATGDATGTGGTDFVQFLGTTWNETADTGL